MSESYVQVPADSTGKKMRTVHSTIGADDVHNEGVVVCDPTTPTQVLTIDSNGYLTVASIVGALPAGTNAIGKLAANTGVDIGDVDVTSIAAGSNTIGKVYITDGTEDASVNASNYLEVSIAQDDVGIGGGTQYAEDAAHSTGATGTLALVVRQDTATQLADTDADYSVLINDANGRLHVLDPNTATIAADTTSIDADTTTIASDTTSIDSKITACNTGAVTISAELPAGTQNIGDVDVASIAAGSNNIGDVDVASIAANSGVDIGDVDVAGRVAHDAAATANSVPIGGRADSTFQAAVSDGDKVDALFDVYGQLRTRVDHANNWSMHYNGSAAQTDTSVQAAPGAGLSVYITDIVFSTGAATACNIFFEEGSTTILGPYYLEATAGRGLSIHFQTPKKCTANTAVTVTTSAAIAQAIDVTGFIAP